MPHAIAWRGHNPFQALPEYLIQSYPSLNAHTVGYGPFWGNGIPEHIHGILCNPLRLYHLFTAYNHSTSRAPLQIFKA